MNFCIDLNGIQNCELLIDGQHLETYLDQKYNFSTLNEKQIKKKVIDIINNEDKIFQILDDLDIQYKYFIEMIYVIYPTIFTTSFINKHVKNTFAKYKKF